MLAGWNVFLAFSYVLVKISFTQMGCDPGIPNFGEHDSTSATWNLTSSCNIDCNCMANKIQPVCYREKNEIFYSACHAGCTIGDPLDDGSFAISNCSCLPDPKIVLTQGTCNEGFLNKLNK